MANDPKTNTQPDAKPTTVPIAKVTFLPGMMLPVPGMQTAVNGAATKDPCAQGFTQIAYDARAQRVRVAWFKPGPDLNRPPTEVRDYPASICVFDYPAKESR